MWMLETNRFGSFVASVSIRVNETALAGSASAFFETKTRPGPVAAQSVEVSPDARSTATTSPPGRSPKVELVSDGPPSGCQSPHGTVKSPVHSLQCARNSLRLIEPMPAVFVRQTWAVPTNSVRLTFGSEIIGT